MTNVDATACKVPSENHPKKPLQILASVPPDSTRVGHPGHQRLRQGFGRVGRGGFGQCGVGHAVLAYPFHRILPAGASNEHLFEQHESPVNSHINRLVCRNSYHSLHSDQWQA